MTDKDDGGAAFPTRKPEYVKRAVGGNLMPDGTAHTIYEDRLEPVDFPGMTLRDWFAGQALAGILPQIMLDGRIRSYSQAALESYKMADAMIAERAK